MDYQKPIVLVQELAANPTFWLMFGISFFNVTWMKFERNVRLSKSTDSWPTAQTLDTALPLINYAIHFYSLFIGWVLYMVEFRKV